jgi:hypothetical protein
MATSISISEIKSFTGDTSNSLGTLSRNYGFTAPDAMSEFINPLPLVYYQFGAGRSWSGSGTTITNFGTGGSSYNGVIQGSVSYGTLRCGEINLSNGSRFYIPATADLYSSNFTWMKYHNMQQTQQSPFGNTAIMWSEAGTKNFLWSYLNVGNYTSPSNPTYSRIDTSATTYFSTVVGTQSNGFGGVGGYFQAYQQFMLGTALVKNGTTFTQYFWDGGTIYKMWEVSISNWSMGSTTQPIYVGAKNDGSFGANENVMAVAMHTEALTQSQVATRFTQIAYTNCY